MMNLKLVSAGLMAVAMLAAPAMARQSHVASRPFAAAGNASASPTSIIQDGGICYPAPRVGAFATAPWTGDNIPCEPGPGY
jgi:hypothetical protein